MSLRVVPVSWEVARDFVRDWHRHLDPPLSAIYRNAVADEDDILRGVALTGRPVSRVLDNGMDLEITRVATDGTRNASSMLYGAAARSVKAGDYRRVITYNQDGESGESLRAAGFTLVARRKARPGWDMPSRPRESHGADDIERGLWERICNQHARPWATASRPEGAEPAAAPTLWDESLSLEEAS